MTNSTASEEAPPITIGDDASAKKATEGFVGGDMLSALNVCFLVALIVGGLFEWAGNTVGACASMFAYLGYGFVFRKSITDMERFGDSAYYLGFILTLLALLLALTGKGGQTITSDGIILQFGLAIWTTFIGMTGRILIIQFLTTARDQGEQARQAITHYVEELNKEVAASLQQIRVFRQEALQSASKIADELNEESKKNRKETTDAVKTAMAALTKSVAQTTTKLDEAVLSVTTRITNLNIPEDALSAPIRQMANAVAEDLGKLRGELEESTKTFATTMRGNAAVLEATKADLGSLRQSLSEVSVSVFDASKIATETLDNAKKNVNTASQVSQGIENLGKTAEFLAQKLTQLARALDDKTQGNIAELDRAKAELKSIQAELTSTVVQSVQKMTDAVRDAAAEHGAAE
jgi:hypothetical protein